MQWLPNVGAGRQREIRRSWGRRFEICGFQVTLLHRGGLCLGRKMPSGCDRTGTVNGCQREKRKQNQSHRKTFLAKQRPQCSWRRRALHFFIGRDLLLNVNWCMGFGILRSRWAIGFDHPAESERARHAHLLLNCWSIRSLRSSPEVA